MKFVYFWLLAISGANLFVDAMQGGDFYGVTEVPYMAQLYYAAKGGFVTFCGATIISEHWVVSAAHCVGKTGFNIQQVRVGSSSTLAYGTLINISKIIVHGNYETADKIYDSDIALIKLELPIEFNEVQQPIPISQLAPRVGDMVTVSGFGLGHYGVAIDSLQVAHARVIDDEACRANYTVTKNMFCTSTMKIDLCFGDSGGPAVLNGKLVGVISQGCEYTAPNVFTKIANYYDWIIGHTGIKYDD